MRGSLGRCHTAAAHPYRLGKLGWVTWTADASPIQWMGNISCHPSKPSESIIRVHYPSRLSESDKIIRVHQASRPSQLGPKWAHTPPPSPSSPQFCPSRCLFPPTRSVMARSNPGIADPSRCDSDHHSERPRTRDHPRLGSAIADSDRRSQTRIGDR